MPVIHPGYLLFAPTDCAAVLNHLVATPGNRFYSLPPLTAPQIDPMLKLREQINGSAAAGTKISVNDFVIKAASLALKKVCVWRGVGVTVRGQVQGSLCCASGLCVERVKQVKGSLRDRV